jgi:hypothetical protein
VAPKRTAKIGNKAFPARAGFKIFEILKQIRPFLNKTSKMSIIGGF